MEVTLTYKKGQNRGAIALWINDDETDTQELIKIARKQMESHSTKLQLTGDEKWAIRRDLF